MGHEPLGGQGLLPTQARVVGVTPARSGNALSLSLDWHKRQIDSNLLLLTGGFGAGKTTLVNHLVQTLRFSSSNLRVTTIDYEEVQEDLAAQPYSANRFLRPGFDEAANNEAGEHVIFVDNFDSANLMSGLQVNLPDARELVPLIRSGARVVVATRRSVGDQSDELIRQVFSSYRARSLGMVSPLVLELIPFSIDDLRAHLQLYPSLALERVVQYLSQFSSLASDHLRRPLLLQMMSQIPLDGVAQGPVVSTAELYKRYVDSALSRDYDLGRSRISQGQKITILADLAFDIFRGVEPNSVQRSVFSVSYSRIKSRVLDLVAQEPSLRMLERHHPYDWTEDLLNTNHVLTERSRRVPSMAVYREFQFDHPTLFEYFVALAMLDRFSRGVSLGLTRQTLSEATFRSLALYFVRSSWDVVIHSDIESLARGRLTWADRLIVLFILEMHERFAELLERAGPKYLDEIEAALPSIGSHFIRKAIAYQLIISGRHSAYDYINDIRIHEQIDDYETERHIHGGSGDITDQLIERFENPALQAGLPIAVFRMGQMGDQRCVPLLESLVVGAEPRLRMLAREAIAAIEGRTSGSSMI